METSSEYFIVPHLYWNHFEISFFKFFDGLNSIFYYTNGIFIERKYIGIWSSQTTELNKISSTIYIIWWIFSIIGCEDKIPRMKLFWKIGLDIFIHHRVVHKKSSRSENAYFSIDMSIIELIYFVNIKIISEEILHPTSSKFVIIARYIEEYILPYFYHMSRIKSDIIRVHIKFFKISFIKPISFIKSFSCQRWHRCR